MRIIVSANDFGLSDGIPTTILDAVDHGLVTSVSIIANGHGFDRALREYQKRPRLELAVHLELIEGLQVREAELRDGASGSAGFAR